MSHSMLIRASCSVEMCTVAVEIDKEVFIIEITIIIHGKIIVTDWCIVSRGIG